MARWDLRRLQYNSFLAACWTKTVNIRLLVVKWKVSLALKRHHSSTIIWGWQGLVYMWAGPFSSCQRCSPLIFASKCGPCCRLNAICSELSGRCASQPGPRSGPWFPPLQLSACILVCLVTSDMYFGFLYPIFKVVCFQVIDSNCGSVIILLSETLSSWASEPCVSR